MARQQYNPSVFVFVVGSDVAFPPKSVTAPPTSVPPVAQLPPFSATSDGWQRTNVTLPVSGNPETAPVTVAVSVTAVPR